MEEGSPGPDLGQRRMGAASAVVGRGADVGWCRAGRRRASGGMGARSPEQATPVAELAAARRKPGGAWRRMAAREGPPRASAGRRRGMRLDQWEADTWRRRWKRTRPARGGRKGLGFRGRDPKFRGWTYL